MRSKIGADFDDSADSKFAIDLDAWLDDNAMESL